MNALESADASERLHFPPDILRHIDAARLTEDGLGRSEARVFDAGDCFLKVGPRDSLRRAAVMQEYFAQKGLSAPLMAFEQDGERDYLLVKALPGQNACRCMDDPAWLSGVLGESVRALHETDARDCPLRDGNRRALEAYEREMGAPYAGDASILRTDALIMGDCCLPNIFFDGRRFVGFIDLGDAGLGDRHFDLCWVLWSLRYNLGDGRYNGRLLDAYGRDIVDDERLRLCTELSLQKELL
ncbi:MAG: phosphotransferase [Clostridia bacterium]|nr:phosphotransferase [Clostridia bacterium]